MARFVAEDHDEPTPSERVIARVAETAAVAPETLPPLYEAVDPDSLDQLFSDTSSGTRTAGHVTFTYAGYHVSVAADGQISLDELVQPGVASPSGVPETAE